MSNRKGAGAIAKLRRGVADEPTRHASERNAEMAYENIKHKMSILENWIEKGVPFRTDGRDASKTDEVRPRELDYFPKTLRQFNLWDGTENCSDVQRELGRIRRNAPQTLRKGGQLQNAVSKLLTALENRVQEQIRSQRPHRISKLNRELVIAQSRVSVLEGELIEHRLKLKMFESDLRKQEAKNSLISSESHRAIGALNDLVGALRAENSDLVRRLLKVMPLRSVDEES